MKQFSDLHPKTTNLQRRDGSLYLCIDRPFVLAAFFAFCNGKGTDTRIFLRGCTKYHATAYPSLFRGIRTDRDSDEQQWRWRAYQAVLKNLRELKGKRWGREDLGAVLQHYGIRTPWLDVVRNLYTAIWFATHELSDSRLHVAVKPTKSDHCWISFYRRKFGTEKKLLLVKDLAAVHSSTHVRPHTQHGVSLAMQPDDANIPCPFQDFNKYRIAQVHFPNREEWHVSGHMFSTPFMFPSPDNDDSLLQLSCPSVQKILDDACRKFNLQQGTLGNISSYG